MSIGYLIINIATVFVPFVFSFHPKLKFYKEWNHFLSAALITSAPFILWDLYFTELGIWGFNPDYLTGYYLGNLPIEEVLFFFCIPFSCVFTYFCLDRLFNLHFLDKVELYISYSLFLTLALLSIIHFGKEYSFFTFLSLSLFILVLKLILKPDWLGKFYFVFIILLVPFLIVNGILTGSFLTNPIVWYNNSENLGIRILTIPIEDFFYAFLLLGLNILFYEKFRRKALAK